MKRYLLALALVLVSAPAFADKHWMSTEAFEENVTGRAMQLITQSGELFGTEYFLPKRQVIFVEAGTTNCAAGSWAPRGDAICYTYAGGYGSCLRYYQDAEKLVGVDWLAGRPTSSAMTLILSPEVFPTCTEN